MKNYLYSQIKIGVLVLLICYGHVSKAGNFYLPESKSKTVLIAGHNLIPNSTSVLDKYKAVNEYFIEQMKLLWTYNAGKEFVSRDKADEMINSKGKNLIPIVTFSILEYVIVSDYKDDAHTGVLFEEINYNYGNYHYTVNLQGFPGQKEIVSGILMLQYLLRKAEITKRSNSFTYELVKNNLGVLQQKTLLLNKNKLDADLNEEGIKEVYPYKFNIVDKGELEEAVINRKPGFAYVVSYLMPTPALLAASAGPNNTIGRAFMQIVIDSETGETLSFASQVFAKSINDSSIPVSQQDLKMFVKRAGK